jgi:hypothetical protein
MVDGGLADCGAVEVMEVVWPSGVGLRGQALNRPQLHWLKTVVVSVVGKVAARPRQVWVGEMSDGCSWSSAVDVSKCEKTMSKPGQRSGPGRRAWGLPVYCPGGIRHRGSMNPTEALLWNV